MDITTCSGQINQPNVTYPIVCHLRASCRRFDPQPSEFQSMFIEIPLDVTNQTCEYYQEVRANLVSSLRALPINIRRF